MIERGSANAEVIHGSCCSRVDAVVKDETNVHGMECILLDDLQKERKV